MVRIERHQIANVENRIKLGFERGLTRFPANIDQSHQTWSAARGLFTAAIGLVGTGSLVPAIPEVQRAVRLASDVSACLFSCGAGQKPGTIDGRAVAFSSVSDNSILHASGWIEAFYLGLIGRQQPNLDALCRVPVSALRQSTTRDLEFRFAFVETLQSVHLERPVEQTGDLLLRTLEQTDPDRYALRAPDWVLSLDVQELGLLGRFLSGDARAFEDALIKAIQSHKQYWSKDADRKRDSTGFLSIPLTAIASLAYDNGFRFEIDSEYLPMWLVRGEFPT